MLLLFNFMGRGFWVSTSCTSVKVMWNFLDIDLMAYSRSFAISQSVHSTLLKCVKRFFTILRKRTLTVKSCWSFLRILYGFKMGQTFLAFLYIGSQNQNYPVARPTLSHYSLLFPTTCISMAVVCTALINAATIVLCFYRLTAIVPFDISLTKWPVLR